MQADQLPWLDPREGEALATLGRLEPGRRFVSLRELRAEMEIGERNLRQVIDALARLQVLERAHGQVRVRADLGAAVRLLAERHQGRLQERREGGRRRRNNSVVTAQTDHGEIRNSDHGEIRNSDHGEIRNSDLAMIRLCRDNGIVAPASLTTPIDRARSGSLTLNDDDVKIHPPSDGPGPVDNSGRGGPVDNSGRGAPRQPAVGEGAKSVGPVLHRLIELAYELWPSWGSAPMAEYMAPLAELGAPAEQLERYLRAQATLLVPKDKGGTAGCPPKLAGAAPTCRGWLRRDNAKRAQKAAREAEEKASAWRAVRPETMPLPVGPGFQKSIEAAVDAAPGPLDPLPAAGLPVRRPFQVRVATPPAPRVAIGPPEVDTGSPELAEIRRQFRALGVDPDRGRKAAAEAAGGVFEAALAKIAGPGGLKITAPGASGGRLLGR